MYVKLNNLKKPQKQKYRLFAWKTEDKPFEAYETDNIEWLRKMTWIFLVEERDYNVNIRKDL